MPKIFDREPTLWIAALNAVIMIVGTVGLQVVSIEQAGLFVAVVNALFAAANAVAVRPISPVTFTYLVGTIVALFASYGLELPTATVAGINAAVIPILALLARGQVTPANTAISRESTSAEVSREVGAPGPTAPVA